MRRSLWLGLILAPFLRAGGPELVLGPRVRDGRCAVAAGTRFRITDPAVFAHLAPGRYSPRAVQIEWLDPDGVRTTGIEWNDLPPGSCLITRLPVAGFDAGRKPGTWTVRATLDGHPPLSRTFVIEGRQSETTITAANVHPGQHQLELELTGRGFGPAPVVHIARFTPSGGWQYLAAELPARQTGTSLTIRTRPLDAGEYIAVIRAGDGSLSAPARFVIASGRSYGLPVPSGERWQITQGPHGGFSHWNRSEHAFDIAPIDGRYVVAMRTGIVHTHDLGMGRTPNLRSFGNYITIDHNDGEYSHYAHLATGRFLVRDRQHVEAGQRLAVVGNSGYTLGAGGGYHVHVHVTRSPAISAQSIPFRFDEDRGPAPLAAAVTRSNPPKPGRGRPGTVMPAQWWSELVAVPAHTSLWEVLLAWDGAGDELDLHLMSPSGRHYGWYGTTAGYSGRQSRPQQFRVPDPEPGTWRISVQGIRGAGPIAFQVTSELTAKPAVHTAGGHPHRRPVRN